MNNSTLSTNDSESSFDAFDFKDIVRPDVDQRSKPAKAFLELAPLEKPTDTTPNDNLVAPSFEYTFGEEVEAPEQGWKRKLRLFCFHCNRMELHFNSLKLRPFYSLLLGATFGLIALYGPFRCRCCGHTRLLRFNRLHPKFIMKEIENPTIGDK